MVRACAVAAAALLPVALSQNVGTQKTEKHPVLTVSKCTKADGCTDSEQSVTIDGNWRWTHSTEGATNCYTGNKWDPTLCPDAETCTTNCALEGADEEYTNTYGVLASGKELTLMFVTQGPYSTNIGSRVYLLEDEETYQMFKLKNKEFTFDVDVSNLPCGLNGALYFSQMDADGGKSRYPTNKAGAKYGTGYCDAQCPHDIKFINGQANMESWEPSSTDPNSGTGKYGSCCTEFDVWEGNSISSAYTAHACNVTEQTRCEGVACGDNDPTPGGSGGHRFDGVCDKNGCDFQTFRLGDETFFGPGEDFKIDTTKPMRVFTQFLTDDQTDTGNLVEVRRFFKQGDNTVHLPALKVGENKHDSLKVDYCQDEVNLYKDHTNFLDKGGFKATDIAFTKGMVLSMSLWDDHYANMLWLDSTYPATQSGPGVKRGTCATTSGAPKDVEGQHPHAFVRYMNIKWGELGSTDVGPIPGPSPAPPTPGPGPSPSPTPSPPHPCGSSKGCTCNPGMNNDGRNMGNYVVAASEAECCDACQQQSGCVGWTWVPQSGNQCWLKDQIGDLRPDGSVTSGSVGASPTPSPTPSPAPTPTPTPPSGCPGGSLTNCIDLCPAEAAAYKACCASCEKRCKSLLV